MAQLCPAPGPDDPLVHSLLGVVDCNVEGLVHGGYATLFAPSGAFGVVLTSLLTIYVAILGYRLLLGRGDLRVGDLALTAIKIGAVLALATGWSTYQTAVYDFLFRGPTELANAIIAGVQPRDSLFRGDVFDGLQAVFDALNAFAAKFGQQAAAVGTVAAGGPGFAARALTASAMTLLLSSLGVILAAKVVLGLLLAVGPIFIALLLFDSTRGVFEGWLRASLSFAFAPLAATVILGVTLTVLEPSLLRLREQLARGEYSLDAVYSVLILVIVFAGVAVGTLIAGAIIGLGLRLPRARRSAQREEPVAGGDRVVIVSHAPSRAARVAAAASALERREGLIHIDGAAAGDRRTSITMSARGSNSERTAARSSTEARLGQGPRRGAGPSARRGDARSAR